MNRRQRSLRHHKKITVNALENVPNVLLVEPKELFDSQITSLLAQVFFWGQDHTSWAMASKVGDFSDV